MLKSSSEMEAAALMRNFDSRCERPIHHPGSQLSFAATKGPRANTSTPTEKQWRAAPSIQRDDNDGSHKLHRPEKPGAALHAPPPAIAYIPNAERRFSLSPQRAAGECL